MLRYVFKRLLYLIPVMFGVLVLVFLMKLVMPGDPVEELLPTSATEEQREALREELGLNDPVIKQFGDYVWGIISRGDLGTSYKSKQPVMTELLQRFPKTVAIGVIGLGISLLIATPLGILAAVKQYSWVDNLIVLFTIVGASLPSFWLALMMIMLFSVRLGWLPAMYNGSWVSFIMPIIAVSLTAISATVRGMRTNMLEMIRQDYVRTARAKGQKESIVIVNHAFRNTLVPVVAGIGNGLGMLLGGSLIVETVFAVPGIGKYVTDAVSQRNFPAVQGGIVMLAFIYAIINIAVDICYTVVDPRLKTTFITAKKRKRVKKEVMISG
ncbi:MAG TPA: ABC transporter permease [Clostridiales bacterium]|nr:ABC transporter permease [Clostridiales bacterium]